MSSSPFGDYFGISINTSLKLTVAVSLHQYICLQLSCIETVSFKQRHTLQMQYVIILLQLHSPDTVFHVLQNDA